MCVHTVVCFSGKQINAYGLGNPGGPIGLASTYNTFLINLHKYKEHILKILK